MVLSPLLYPSILDFSLLFSHLFFFHSLRMPTFCANLWEWCFVSNLFTACGYRFLNPTTKLVPPIVSWDLRHRVTILCLSLWLSQ